MPSPTGGNARVEGRRLAVASALLFLVLTTTATAQSALIERPRVERPAPSERQRVEGSAADRMIDGKLVVHRGAITPDVLVAIAKSARIPLGLETLPDSALAPGMPVERQKRLTGLTVREALNWLVRMDPRYRWEEVSEKRVVVIRPVAAWEDAQHFLHGFVDEFTAHERSPRDVLAALASLIRQNVVEFSPRATAPPVPLTFAVRRGTFVDVLDEAARVGGLAWEIDYGVRSAGRVSLWLHDPEQKVGIDLPFAFPSWVESAGLSTPLADASILDRVIDVPLSVRDRQMTREIAWSISRITRAPVGIETFPYDARIPAFRPDERTWLTGMTVREAFDRLVKLDPRYHWVESRGVVVVRPVTAWGYEKHFLNTMLDPIAVKDVAATDVIRALGTFYEFGTFALPGMPEWPWAPVTFSVGHASGLDVLNEIARSGGLCWHISYNSPQYRFGNAHVDIGFAESGRRGGGGFFLWWTPLPAWLRNELK